MSEVCRRRQLNLSVKSDPQPVSQALRSVSTKRSRRLSRLSASRVGS